MKKFILSLLFCVFSLSACSSNQPAAETTISPETSTTAETSLEQPSEALTDGRYTIDDLELDFYQTIPNDVTGNWKLSILANDKDILNYAADYYQTFFVSDREIHAVINTASQTTSCIGLLGNDLLNIKVFTYIPGEEGDASELFGGELLKEYTVNLKTDEVSEIS